MADQCNIDAIRAFSAANVTSSCEFVRQYCGEAEADPYLELFFCTVNQSSILLMLFLVVFFFITFHLLASTAESYLTPALTKLANLMKCTETLAGATLVAFGNGAPDVLVAIAGGSNGEDINFTLGSIFGAGLFVTTITVALVIDKAGGELKLDKRYFLRDTCFYLFATTVMLIFGFVGKINWWMAVCFFSIYIVFFAVCLFMEARMRKSMLLERLNQDLQLSSIESAPVNDGEIFENEQPEIDDTNSLQSSLVDNQFEESLNDNKESIYQPRKKHERSLIEFIKEDHYNDEPDYVNQKPKASQCQDYVPPSERRQNEFNGRRRNSKIGGGMIMQFQRLKHRLSHKMLTARDNWSEMEFMDKVLYIWEIPADFLRDIIIPPSDENWNRWRAIVNCLTAPMFFLFVGGLIPNLDPTGKHLPVTITIACLSVVCAFLVWKTTHAQQCPRYIWVFNIVAFLNSIALIKLIADQLIAFLTFLEILTQTSKVYLGMTFLAFGNSSADYFTNAQLAKMGYGVMAMTACYSGQLFNMIVGLGITLMTATLSQDDKQIDFQIFKASQPGAYFTVETILGSGVIVFQWLNMICAIIFGFSNKFMMTRSIAYFLRVYYIVIFLAATGLAVTLDLLRTNPLQPSE